MRKLPWLMGPAILTLAGAALADDATVAGAVTTPYPTLQNLSVEWAITGDDNANGVVSVRYRKQGDTDYKQGLPLFRLPAGSNQGGSWANKHSGSIFGLTPGTTYEIELTLTDPDGGGATQSTTAQTRPDPVAAANAHTVNVTPATIDAALNASAPGDLLILGDGTYSEIVAPNDGADGMPVVLRSQNPGGAVVEGDVRLDNRSFVYVEGLTVHGKIKLNDATSIVVRGCTITTPDYGVVAYNSGVINGYFVDNTISGTTVWAESSLGAEGNNLGEGIQITGPGNVVAFNRVHGFRDCLSLLELSEAVNQVSDDFYGNDLSECADDAIEADSAMGNVRVFENRIANSFMGVSSQPSVGGPTYFIRNVMYNVVFESFKLHNGTVGDVLLHNTVIKSGDAFAVFTEDGIFKTTARNNLLVGGPGGVHNGYDSGPGKVLDLQSADPSCSLDYDGYGSIGTNAFDGRVGAQSFTSVAQMQASTSEAHGISVDLSAFNAAISIPGDVFNAAAVPSFTLAAASPAIDKGVVLNNIDDGFTGASPDLGAYQTGQPEPQYGPNGHLGGSGSGGGGGAGASTNATGASNGAGTGSGPSSGSGGAGSGGAANGGSSDGGGCGCEIASPSSSRWGMGALAFAAALALARRDRARRIQR